MNSVVVVMPAFNAEKTLSPVVKGLRMSLPGSFVIGVNDGSEDGTGALLRSVCDRTIEFPSNRGKGAALRAGFAAALERKFATRRCLGICSPVRSRVPMAM